ncbi:hypothetical protein IEQ34_017747 [Dendrobium chrysotoxum]|uniref:HMA domain-containing protein n=1 Tax=Dendrobium chrysotoxum TaxID=161865 RepID=A0AAV7GDF9_DENCH|nr:hypothetical protein IEQ34_017747 [Dendrobium chrysotoxum]
MDLNGKGSLLDPLLQSSENVTINMAQAPRRDDFKTRKIKFKIGGISCASCTASIELVVGAKEGVESVMVSPIQGHAVIVYRPEIVNEKFFFGANIDVINYLAITLAPALASTVKLIRLANVSSR